MLRISGRLATAVAASCVLGIATVAVPPAGAAPARPGSALSPVRSTPKAASGSASKAQSASNASSTSKALPGETVLIVTASKSEQAALTRSVQRVRSMTAVDGSGVRATFRKSLPSIGAISLQVPTAQAQSVAASLRKQGGVSSVEVTSPLHFDSVTPNDPEWSTNQKKYLGKDGVNANAAWSVQEGSPEVKIAILDSGVTVDHPDLENQIVGAYNADDGSSDVTDTLGHGTFVAGVAAAQADNGIGIAGAGFDSGILAVKVANAEGDILTDDVITGINWAVAHGANVINMSFSSTVQSPAMAMAVAKAEAAGVVVVASAGNSGNIGDPAQYPADDSGVISVGATDGATQRASFSQYGSRVTVGAPGVNIASTTNPDGSYYFPAESYGVADGTSFSSPIVAGEAALLKAQSPTASEAQIRAAIVNSAHGYAGQGLGHGQVDFALALKHLPPPTIPTMLSPVEGATGSGVITFSAASTAPQVQFIVSGAAVGSPVPVVDGVARPPGTPSVRGTVRTRSVLTTATPTPSATPQPRCLRR